MESRYFESAEAMSDHQADRELQEALHFSTLPPEEKFQWLEANWGRLQDGASSLRSGVPTPMTGRFYFSMTEKNCFDDDREIERALQIQKVNNAPSK